MFPLYWDCIALSGLLLTFREKQIPVNVLEFEPLEEVQGSFLESPFQEGGQLDHKRSVEEDPVQHPLSSSDFLLVILLVLYHIALFDLERDQVKIAKK